MNLVIKDNYSFQCVVTSHTSTSYLTLCNTGSSTHGAVGGGCMVADLTSFTARQEKEQLKKKDTKPVMVMNFYQVMLQRFSFYWQSRLTQMEANREEEEDGGEEEKEDGKEETKEKKMKGDEEEDEEEETKKDKMKEDEEEEEEEEVEEDEEEETKKDKMKEDEEEDGKEGSSSKGSNQPLLQLAGRRVAVCGRQVSVEERFPGDLQSYQLRATSQYGFHNDLKVKDTVFDGRY